MLSRRSSWPSVSRLVCMRVESLLMSESMVRKGGLEPPRAAPLEPKSSASTNSATFASPRPAAFPACSRAGIATGGTLRAATPSPFRRAATNPGSAFAERAIIADAGPSAKDGNALASFRCANVARVVPHPVSVAHYENFPVASFLLPRAHAGGRRSRSTASRAPPTTSPTKATLPPAARLAGARSLRARARRHRRRAAAAGRALCRARGRDRAAWAADRAFPRPPVRVPPGRDVTHALRHRRRAPRLLPALGQSDRSAAAASVSPCTAGRTCVRAMRSARRCSSSTSGRTSRSTGKRAASTCRRRTSRASASPRRRSPKRAATMRGAR